MTTFRADTPEAMRDAIVAVRQAIAEARGR